MLPSIITSTLIRKKNKLSVHSETVGLNLKTQTSTAVCFKAEHQLVFTKEAFRATIK